MADLSVILRPASAGDLPVIGDIYSYYVAHSTCTFDTEPRPAQKWLEWLEEHTGPTPAIVATIGGKVVGWGSLSKWNNRCAYRFSVEDSVYVHGDFHRRGIGRTLLGELIQLAQTHGHRNIVAQIAGDQGPSEALHRALGFRRVGCLEKIGFKFDRWIDVAIWQLQLTYEDSRPTK
jgi:phosphinothricin acetyltransferase